MGTCESDTKEPTRGDKPHSSGIDNKWMNLSSRTIGFHKLATIKLSTAETYDMVDRIQLNKTEVNDLLAEHKTNDFKPIKINFLEFDGDHEEGDLHPEFFDREVKLQADRCDFLDELAKKVSPLDFDQSTEEGGLRIIFDSIDRDRDGFIDAKELSKAISIVFELGPAGNSDISSTEILMSRYNEPGKPPLWDFQQFKTFMLEQASVE